MTKVWVASEQREDAEWYVVRVFLREAAAKLWMYGKTNRVVQEVEIV